MSSHALSSPLRLVILAWGNPSRGDDALGPTLAQRIREHIERHARDRCIEVVEDFQLQVEHALDLEDRDLALFIDASLACEAPFGFRRLEAQLGISETTHALAPEAVLYVYRQITGTPAPPSYLLSLRGERFELGEGLGEAAESHLEAALKFVRDLLEETRPARWHSIAEAGMRMDPLPYSFTNSR
jgi:hydrogenase maturation protease